MNPGKGSVIGTIATGKYSGCHGYVGARRSVGAASVHGEAPRRGDFPDLHVFPGGKVDRQIGSLSFAPDLMDAHASARPGVSAGGLRYWVAVARECLKNVVSCWRTVTRTSVAGQCSANGMAKLRQQLLQGDLAWSEVLRNKRSRSLQTDWLFQSLDHAALGASAF